MKKFYPRILYAVYIGILIIGLSPEAFAQDLLSTQQEKNADKSGAEIFALLPPEVQEEIEDEAYKVFLDCGVARQYSTFHNCDCMGAKMIEKRALEPEKVTAVLLAEVQSECIDETEIAGYTFEQCTEDMVLRVADYVGFCSCFANKLAETYKKNPHPYMSPRYIQSLKLQAYRGCGFGDTKWGFF